MGRLLIVQPNLHRGARFGSHGLGGGQFPELCIFVRLHFVEHLVRDIVPKVASRLVLLSLGIDIRRRPMGNAQDGRPIGRLVFRHAVAIPRFELTLPDNERGRRLAGCTLAVQSSG